ncbi:hypothetical protein HPB48_012721 [Haemaphysalis longicornis]|uniref:Uncharacterized protein n=1 Tax=Haemaphysalis longicornis TaxID=44386 RepID=A0A9J6GRV4_HAELO|nr:hypothetical protein HPB48_012721 [Haemaphysalis longicornis]
MAEVDSTEIEHMVRYLAKDQQLTIHITLKLRKRQVTLRKFQISAQSRASSSTCGRSISSSSENEVIKALREANDALRRENVQLREAIEKNTKQMEEMKKWVKANTHEQPQQPSTMQSPRKKPEEEEV